MKNNLKIVLSCIGIVLLVLAFFLKSHLNNNDTYKLNLPKLEEISSLTIDTLAQENNIKTFTNKETIKNVYDVFGDRTTNISSISDNPVEPNELFIVTFINNNERCSISVYEKNNKFYLEQPYNGIYEIKENEYNIIKKYVSDSYSKIADLNLKSNNYSITDLVRYNNVLYGKSTKMIDYASKTKAVGTIDILIGEGYVPKNNNETNVEEILNALVYDSTDESLVLEYNNEFVLFEKIDE